MSLQTEFLQNMKKCSSKRDKYQINNQKLKPWNTKNTWKNEECLNRKIKTCVCESFQRGFKIKFYVTLKGRTAPPPQSKVFSNN